MQEIREKKHRLDPALYVGYHAVAFTLCIKDRKEIFVNENIFRIMEDVLLGSLEKFGVAAHVYLFMPDHLHMLLEGKNEKADIRKCIIDFKQKSGYWFSKNFAVAQWQKDFYDHLLRKDEDVIKHVRYILENPLRKNMATDWKKYPYKGSAVHDLNEW